MNSLGLALSIAILGFAANLDSKPPPVSLPPRSARALNGSVFARSIIDLPLREREKRILAEVEAGNVPSSWRNFVPVDVVSKDDQGELHTTYFVAPDYLAVGSDEDSFLVPLTPQTAQRIADRLECSLPTPKMVDDIYKASSIKLVPSPIPPSPAMTSVPVFLQHNTTIVQQRPKDKPAGSLIAGHKKDVVIAKEIFDRPGKVAIYGWHRLNGEPIQPLYARHAETWVDYSHGIRLVRDRMIVNGQETTIAQVLADPRRSALLSNAGVLVKTRYELAPIAPKVEASSPAKPLEELRLDRGVRIVIDADRAEMERNRDEGKPLTLKPTLLVFFALPNGGTIEQAFGKSPEPGDDWHFDIQHIGAQTRFLRSRIVDRRLVVAYLENDLKSWPAWRRKHGDAAISPIVDAVRQRFARDTALRIALTGHSGGGSLIFGYLNGRELIPSEIERIAFLDANYAYETDRHRDKLTAWLKASDQHYLGVFAYNDAVALLNGKTFVSASGGTWGRSHAMLHDLEKTFTFTARSIEAPNTTRHSALNGRLMFQLTENPQKAILHTVLVERNGFIEALLFGTKEAGQGYSSMGERAYTPLIKKSPVVNAAPNR